MRQTGWKGRRQTVFTDNVIRYVETTKESTKKVLETINELSEVTGY